MANILKIESKTDTVRYIIKFYLESPKVAQYFEARCLLSVREIFLMADLYARGNHLPVLPVPYLLLPSSCG